MPVNTITCDSKLVELIVKKQLTEYIDENNILIEVQSGYRANHSCETTLKLVLEDCSSIPTNEYSGNFL